MPQAKERIVFLGRAAQTGWCPQGNETLELRPNPWWPLPFNDQIILFLPASVIFWCLRLLGFFPPNLLPRICNCYPRGVLCKLFHYSVRWKSLIFIRSPSKPLLDWLQTSCPVPLTGNEEKPNSRQRQWFSTFCWPTQVSTTRGKPLMKGCATCPFFSPCKRSH